jgi:hypothetical protein
MKTLKIMLAVIAMITALSCNKDCIPTDPVCSETPPTNEMCQAYFERWFFDSSSNTCSKIGYSGCSQKGFATEQECLTCQCGED